MSRVPETRHERTHWPSAAEIRARSGYEVLDPACNGAKRVEIALREIARSVDVLEIIEKKRDSSHTWFFGPSLTFLVGRRRVDVTAELDQCHC